MNMNYQFLKIFFWLFLLCLLLAAESKQAASRRIIGGRSANITEFPYQAEIEQSGDHYCGAAIIHIRVLLTAAHCVFHLKNATSIPQAVIRARVGMSYATIGGQRLKIDRVIVHENYDDKVAVDQYDIALVVVHEKIALSKTAQIIPLAKEVPKVGDIAYITGFGRTTQIINKKAWTRSSRQLLMAVELPIISLKQCQKLMTEVGTPVAQDLICAGALQSGKDACTGDSGGPLAINNFLVGVVAWGYGCGMPGMPGMYTSVPYYYQWIEKHIREILEHLK